MNKINDTELKLARLIQKDIEISSHPFEKIAEKLEITEPKVIQSIKKMHEGGLIRKFGVILRHHKAGYKKNALIVWSVPAKQVDKVGTFFSSFPFVSHCYERKPSFKNKYNLFTMVHSQTGDIISLVKELSAAANTNEYLILESIQEYKKTSPEYF